MAVGRRWTIAQGRRRPQITLTYRPDGACTRPVRTSAGRWDEGRVLVGSTVDGRRGYGSAHKDETACPPSSLVADDDTDGPAPHSTFTPLIFSGILYAANGEFPVDYIDCLFNCVSAITVCGLATVDLSGLTPFQQVLLFIQMCLGSPVRVYSLFCSCRYSNFNRIHNRWSSRGLWCTFGGEHLRSFLRCIITSVFVRTRTFPRSVVLAQSRTEKSDGRTCERLGRSDAGPCPRCTTRS